MKKLLLILFIPAFYISEAQNTFQKLIRGGNISASIQQTADSAFIIAGGFTYANYGLIKSDIYGNLIWVKTYDVGTNCGPPYAQQTSDGGFILAGFTNSIHLIKTDPAGDTIWTRTYNGGYTSMSSSVHQTADGGYIVSGSIEKPGVNWDGYLLKIDASGTVQWTKIYEGTSTDWLESVQETTDGGYIMTGITLSFSATEEVLLIKTDVNGNTLWSKRCGSNLYHEEGHFVQQTFDGGYIICGNAQKIGAGNNTDVCIIKTDNNGNAVWSTVLGGSDYDEAACIKQTGDGGYVAVGRTWSFGAGNGDVYMLKVDMNGNLNWSHTFGGGDIDEGYGVVQTIDGGFMISGEAHSFSNTIGGYLIKTDSVGNSGCNQSSPNTVVASPSVISTDVTFQITSGCNVSYSNIKTGSGYTDTVICDLTTNKPPDIYIPNAFSPNQDGENDVLYVQSKKPLKNMELIIYDRWGSKIFETTNQLLGWDGAYHDDKLNTAIFVFNLHATLANGKEYFQKGNITLVR